MPEIVYIATNPLMPNIIKIGKTIRDDVRARLAELYNSHTGVPVPFDCYYKVAVEDSGKVEKALHAAFEVDRVNPKREFFRTQPHRIVALLKAYALPDQSIVAHVETSTDVSPAEMEASDRVIQQDEVRSNFTFIAADVPIGAELVYTLDDTKKCKVVAEKKVEYEGEQYTLSGLASKFRKDAGYKSTSVAGTLYFVYEDELHKDETLSERRIRIEREAKEKE